MLAKEERLAATDRLQRILLLAIVLTVIGWGVYGDQQNEWRETLRNQLVFNTLFTHRTLLDQLAKGETNTPQDIAHALASRVLYGNEKTALIKEVSKLPWLEHAKILTIPLYRSTNECTIVMYPYNVHTNEKSPEQIRAVWIFQKNIFCELLPYATIPKGLIFDQEKNIKYWLFEERAADYIFPISSVDGTHYICDIFDANCQKTQTVAERIKFYLQKRIFTTYHVTPVFPKDGVFTNTITIPEFSGDLTVLPHEYIYLTYRLLIKGDDSLSIDNLQQAAEREREKLRKYYGSDVAEFGGMKLTYSLMFYFPFLGIATMLYIMAMSLFYVKQLNSLQSKTFFSLASTFTDRARDTFLLRWVWVVTPILSVISWLLIFQSFYKLILDIPFTSVSFYFDPLELDFEILNEYSYFPLSTHHQLPNLFLLNTFALAQVYLLILAVRLTRDIYCIAFSRKKLTRRIRPISCSRKEKKDKK